MGSTGCIKVYTKLYILCISIQTRCVIECLDANTAAAVIKRELGLAISSKSGSRQAVLLLNVSFFITAK